MDEYDSKIEEERSDDDRNYMEALNMSANESEDYDHRSKYLPPLPSTANNSKKKMLIEIMKLIMAKIFKKSIAVIYR